MHIDRSIEVFQQIKNYGLVQLQMYRDSYCCAFLFLKKEENKTLKELLPEKRF